MSKSSSSQTYLRFLHLANAVRQMPSLPVLDAVEERLINVFAAGWHEGRQITVLEAARMVPDASERTVFRRLKTLQEKGLLKLGTSPHDQRVRYVMPTAQTEHYFDTMGRCIEHAQQA